MILGDLLDELRHNLLRDNSDMVAGHDPILWSDATLVRYIDQAQKVFARRSLIIRDGDTEAVTKITLATGVDEYACHPSVIAVISARLDGDTGDLKRISRNMTQPYDSPDEMLFDVNAPLTLPNGKPIAFYTDEEIKADGSGHHQLVTLKVYPKPSADYNGDFIRLRVARAPINDLVIGSLNAEAELPQIWQLDMLYWAAARALDVMDRDAGDAGRSDRYMAKFDRAVQEAATQARRNLYAKDSWGFGRNGFSWSR
jgi:hypothetical protein